VRLIPDPVWKALEAYPWPGNVRELRNAIERCVLFSEGETFPERWLQLPGSEAELPARAEPEGDRVPLPLDGSLSLDAMEREILARALERTGGNLARAARLLGTTRQTLRYRVQKHGLGRPAGVPREEE
jgi:DNA-binding NtrC family response regulator